MNPYVLICLVGLPRAGKSTYAAHMREKGYPVVNPDSIRLAIHGQRFVAEAEELVWATAKIMVRSLFLAGHRAVVLDATNINRESRCQWLNKMWSRRFVHIGTPPSVCVERAIEGGYPDLVPVIEKMAVIQEPPTEEEGPVEVIDWKELDA